MSRPESAPALVLVGPMGAGKTSIGRRAARELGLRFADTDALIVRAHGPIPEIFATHGERRFREIERDTVAAALASGGVVSLGGGSVIDADTRARLSEHRVAFLTVSPVTVASRLRGSNRPLLADEEDPIARWQAIFAERRPLYEEVADATFDTSSGPLSAVVADIAEWYRGGHTDRAPAGEDRI